MIHTWIADITPLCDFETYQKFYKELPAFRKEKADQCRFQERKAQSAGVWLLLEKARKSLGVSDKAVFNLSHSGSYVLCSIDDSGSSSTLLGCDLEQYHDVDLKFAKRYFCTSEYEAVMEETDEEKRREMFCRFWVLKESFMKATRKGMALGTKNFEILLGDPSTLIMQPEEFSQKFYYKEYEISGLTYKIAVCSTKKHFSGEIHREFIGLFSEEDHENENRP